MIGLRASPEMRERIEYWSSQQDDQPTLSEAIRRLVDTALAASAPGQRSPESTASAQAMAEAGVDKALAKSRLPEPVKESRKKQLTKMPRELRGKRV